MEVLILVVCLFLWRIVVALDAFNQKVDVILKRERYWWLKQEQAKAEGGAE